MNSDDSHAPVANTGAKAEGESSNWVRALMRKWPLAAFIIIFSSATGCGVIFHQIFGNPGAENISLIGGPDDISVYVNDPRISVGVTLEVSGGDLDYSYAYLGLNAAAPKSLSKAYILVTSDTQGYDDNSQKTMMPYTLRHGATVLGEHEGYEAIISLPATALLATPSQGQINLSFKFGQTEQQTKAHVFIHLPQIALDETGSQPGQPPPALLTELKRNSKRVVGLDNGPQLKPGIPHAKVR